MLSVLLTLLLAAPTRVDLGEPFGRVELVDEVRCGDPADPHPFAEAPSGASEIQYLLGRPHRVLPTAGRKGAAYFAYKLGAGKGLKAGEAYVLAVDYPDDRSRAWHIVNRGAELFQGFSTGTALGDSMHGYVSSNSESLSIPQSGTMRTWRQLFFLFDRFYEVARKRDEPNRPGTPESGFWVVVMRPDPGDDPPSAGPAVHRIRLFRVPEVERLYLKLRRPPPELPWRHVFVREEMADGYAEGLRGGQPGVDMTRWFEDKARQMRFLGMDTYCKDLLEFGHNQGWDAGDDEWVVPSHDPGRWERILQIAARHSLFVLPYYEYAGTRGLNQRVQCVPLKGPNQPYTSISWTEIYHCDVTDPLSLEDVRRLLDRTILRYRDRVRFLGAWFRNRLSHWPISFSDAALQRFGAESGVPTPTREQLRQNADLRDRYYDWWLGKRRAFLLAIRDTLRQSLSREAMVWWTNWNSEGGPALHNGKVVVTDNPETWKPMLPEWWEVRDAAALARTDEYLRSITAWPVPWSNEEPQHGEPRADPWRYRDDEGILLTYPLSRAYTAARPADMEAFRTRSGLAASRFFPLNEHRDGGLLGDFLSDVERAGPWCMLAEARAVAHGDPRTIGYLAGNTHTRGFPEYVRRFHAAFLALPALPSKPVPDASEDPEVVVRRMDAGKTHGVYYAVVNTGLQPKRNVRIYLPNTARVVDAATGAALTPRGTGRGRHLLLNLYPAELRAIHIP